jgi:hypothetical protein
LKQQGLQRHSGRRKGRLHDGKVVVMRSNLRWCSDVFEILCWNGDIVRIVFVIDAHDREVLAWHAAAGIGISGSMVRDLMLEAVELRFGTAQAPNAVEWLSDNGSPFTARETLGDAVNASSANRAFTGTRLRISDCLGSHPESVMRASYVNDPNHLRERATEMRASSKELKDDNTAAVIMRLADLYDRLADRAENRGNRAVLPDETKEGAWRGAR